MVKLPETLGGFRQFSDITIQSILKAITMFTDRQDAALQLATALGKYRGSNPVVLGIPRGGAETAYYVALGLEGEFSLLVSRKLGHPGNPEYAFGAIAEDGTVYLRPNAVAELTGEVIQQVSDAQKKEIERRVQSLRKGKPLPGLKGKTVILVDDGIATGATLLAAIEMCKKQQPSKLVVAAPVSGAEMEAKLKQLVDEVVILEVPDHYYAVSQAYENFYNLSDAEVLNFMDQWQRDKKR